ncbi:phosphoethanolamine N-methyltransferase [Methanophagales archaeon]|nr:phosphoethanolamine N-methyltransferase [Methanophagales archaeon]
MTLLENEAELVNRLCARILDAECEGGKRKILDLGCGRGKLAIYLSEETGCDVTGVDPSRERIEKARERSSSVPFEVQPAEETTFADNTFDVVVSLKSWHEMVDPKVALQESLRLLTEGGKIYIIDWVGGVAHTKKYFSMETRAHAKKYFTAERLGEMLSEAGFSDIQIEFNMDGELMLAEGQK